MRSGMIEQLIPKHMFADTGRSPEKKAKWEGKLGF